MIERLLNPPRFIESDETFKIIMSPGIYARKTAYQIDPLLRNSVVIGQPSNPRAWRERDGGDLWKQRLTDTKGNRYWQPMVAILLVIIAIGVDHRETLAVPACAPASVGLSDTGYHVQQVQYKLKSFRYSVQVDGDFGMQTWRAVANFQKVNGLAPDGCVGPLTLGRLGLTLGSPAAATKRAVRVNPPAPAVTHVDPTTTEGIIRDVWSGETADIQDWAVRIAKRESSPALVVTAHNACCYGIFQIHFTAHRAWLANFGVTKPSDLYDPRVSATVALALFHEARNGPWLCHGQCVDIPLP